MGRAPKRKWATTVNWASQTIFRFHHAIFGIAEVVDHVANNGFPIPFPTTATVLLNFGRQKCQKWWWRIRWDDCSTVVHSSNNSMWIQSTSKALVDHVEWYTANLTCSRWVFGCYHAKKREKKKTAGHTSPIAHHHFPSQATPLFFHPFLSNFQAFENGDVPHQNRANKEHNPGQPSWSNHLAGRSPAKCFEKKNGKTCGNLLSDWQLLDDLRKYNVFQEASKCHALFAIV